MNNVTMYMHKIVGKKEPAKEVQKNFLYEKQIKELSDVINNNHKKVIEELKNILKLETKIDELKLVYQNLNIESKLQKLEERIKSLENIKTNVDVLTENIKSNLILSDKKLEKNVDMLTEKIKSDLILSDKKLEKNFDTSYDDIDKTNIKIFDRSCNIKHENNNHSELPNLYVSNVERDIDGFNMIISSEEDIDDNNATVILVEIYNLKKKIVENHVLIFSPVKIGSTYIYEIKEKSKIKKGDKLYVNLSLYNKERKSYKCNVKIWIV